MANLDIRTKEKDLLSLTEMKPVRSSLKLLLFIVAIAGFTAVILAIVGVTTKNWVEVQGSTTILNNTIHTAVLPNLTATISGALGPSPLAPLINAGVRRAFDAVVANIGHNLEPTTYTLFEKSSEATTVSDLGPPQGLIIAGLTCLFIGTILAFVVGIVGLWRAVSIIPLMFLMLGPILITIGYLLYAKVVVEDFGHELGVTVHLGYSLMIIVVSSIVGYMTAVLYALTIFHRHYSSRRNGSHDGGQVLVSSVRPAKQSSSSPAEASF